jgi:hypothetical protein
MRMRRERESRTIESRRLPLPLPDGRLEAHVESELMHLSGAQQEHLRVCIHQRKAAMTATDVDAVAKKVRSQADRTANGNGEVTAAVFSCAAS